MAKGKEKEVEKEQRMQEIKSLALELRRSPNSEVKTLARLIFLMAEENVDLMLELLYETGGQFPTLSALLKDQSELNMLLIDGLAGLNQKLSEIKDTKPTENPEIRSLAARVKQEEDNFAQYEQTLEDLRVWSQGRVTDWVRKRFGGSSDEQ